MYNKNMNEFTSENLTSTFDRFVEALSSREYVSKTSRNVTFLVFREFEKGTTISSAEDFVEALKEQLSDDQTQNLTTLLESPSARFEAIFGKEKLDEIAYAGAHVYMDKFALKFLAGDYVADNAKKTVSKDVKSKYISAEKKENKDIREFLKRVSLMRIVDEYFDQDELENASGRLDVLDVLEQDNPAMAVPIIGLIKHHYFDLRPGKSLAETAELLKDRVADLQIPEDVRKGLFSKSWIATCAFSLKRRFSEDELKRDSLFPLVGAKHEDKPIAAQDISTRLGAGGFLELAREGRYPNDGSGRARENRYVGHNAPKPPCNG